ncbi:MAG TPA: hypothetical protein VMU29_00290 [Smithella sp.]|nr:hypothetical protein [Smithella sp.]
MQKKPTYNLETFVNEDFVKIVITGEVTKDDIYELTNEVSEIVKLNNTKKLLCDIRAVKGRLGYTDTYLYITNLSSVFYNINIVFVDIPENAKLQSFLQSVARQTGINVKWCTDPDDAISWLKSLSS